MYPTKGLNQLTFGLDLYISYRIEAHNQCWQHCVVWRKRFWYQLK